MNNLTSNMPSASEAEEVRREQVMRIERVVVTDMPSTRVRLNIDTVTRNGEGVRKPVVCNMWTIDLDRVRGYLPSKVWYDQDRQLHAVFYCSSALPTAVRAFGDGPTYVCAFQINEWTTVEYGVDMRLFIDQVQMPGGDTWYVMMFGEKESGMIVSEWLERDKEA